MHERLIEKLRSMPGISLEEREQSWLVRIPERGGFRFEIVIPRQVLEWFVDAYDPLTGRELWSDWTAWYSFKGGPLEAELPGLFAKDVEYFISRLVSADAYRVARVPGPRLFGLSLGSLTHLEGRVRGTWQKIGVGELPAA